MSAVANQHNDKLPDYVAKMESVVKLNQKNMPLYMITSDTWEFKQEINNNNVCIVSQLN
jgi:hypothetical protein